VCIFCGRELKSLVGRGRADLSVRFPFLNSSVFLRYVSGFLNRQCLDRVPTSGGGGCSKHGVVDRLLGGFNYRQKQGGHCVIRQYLDVVEDGERGRNRTFNLLIKSQLLCHLSYAPVSGLSFSPGDPPILSRVAGDHFMLQPGSCLPEPLDQLTANNVNEYNTGDCTRTNSRDRGLRAMDYERRSALE